MNRLQTFYMNLKKELLLVVFHSHLTIEHLLRMHETCLISFSACLKHIYIFLTVNIRLGPAPL